MDEHSYLVTINNVAIGKRLPTATYVHISAVSALPDPLSNLVMSVSGALNLDESWNVVKLSTTEFRISFLDYDNFDLVSYPILSKSTNVDLRSKRTDERVYSDQDNPPILHRKENLVLEDYPHRDDFALITQEGEAAGLYENTTIIGHLKSWEFLIHQRGYELVDGRLFRKSAVDKDLTINRERTAISRFQLSSPFQAIGKLGFLDGQFSILDYGCGRGDDLSILENEGLDVIGWDPNFRPGGACAPRDIVNLGFVINVIEDISERNEALVKAYENANKLLIVSAMIASEKQIERFHPYKDGVITSRNTFQKYYSQQELREYLNSTLSLTAISLGIGIFAVFKDSSFEFEYLEKRYRRKHNWDSARRVKPTRAQRLQSVFEQNKGLFDEFWLCALSLGRFPKKNEFSNQVELSQLVNAPKQIQELVVANYDQGELEKSALSHREDLILTQAMSIFYGRKTFTSIPQEQKQQIRVFFKTYRQLKGEAKSLLADLSDTQMLHDAVMLFVTNEYPCYYATNRSLTFHKRFINELPLILRTYVECALQLYGDIENIQLIKIHIHTGKISFMGYEDFEEKPIPMLIERIKVNLWLPRVTYYDYVDEFKPKPLYWKSKFISPADASFTKQKSFDEKLDLYGLAPSDPSFGLDPVELRQELSRRSLEIRGYRFYNLDRLG